MAATIQQLVKVRSQLAEAMIAYLKAIEDELARNRLLERFDRKLDDLRVLLRVVPHEPVRDIEEIRAREHFRQTGSGGGDEDADKATRRAYAFRGARIDRDKESRSRPEPLAGLEPKLEMAVLLGDPGSGKTEWLKYRARLAAREARVKLEQFAIGLDDFCFPTWLRLPDVAAELREEKESELRHLLVKTGCVPSMPAPLNDAERAATAILSSLIKHYELSDSLALWVWQRLTARRQAGAAAPILLCLDAWDEISSGQEIVARCLNAYASAAYARILLTSRIIGYSHRPLPVENKTEGPRRELRICPFEWSEAEDFVTDFFRGEPERGKAMLGELRGKIAVSGMAQNPLLATLLCMAFSPNPHRPPLGFPARRVEVYERVLEGLLGEWEAIDKGRKPNRDLISAKIRLLEETAHHFFPDEELSGERLHNFLWNEESGYLKKLDDVHPLKKMLKRNPDTDLIAELCKDAVLVPCGGDDASSFLFLHLTLQEYLAASAIARLINDPEGREWETKIKVAGKRKTVRQLMDSKSWDPRYQEVIVLLSGKLNNPATLVDLLGDEKRDGYFRPRLALAALCLPELSPTIRHSSSEVVNRITTAAFSLWWRHERNGTVATVPHLTRSLPALGQVNGLVSNDATAHKLSKIIINDRSGYRRYGLPLLDLVAVLLRDADPDVRSAAARAIGALGAAAATPDILAAFPALLRYDDTIVRSAAAHAIGALRAFAGRRRLPPNVRSAAASAIRALGAAAATPDILATLHALLRDADTGLWPDDYPWYYDVSWFDADSDARSAAASAIGALGAVAATPDILATLLASLRDGDPNVRSAAASAIGALGTAAATPDILATLLAWLRDDDRFMGYEAASAIGALGAAAATPDILATLLANLRGFNGSSRVDAMMVIEALGAAAATPDILATLPASLHDADSNVRSAAASAIGALGAAAATPDILATLPASLRDADSNVRSAAASAIRRLGAVAATPDILATLPALLRDADSNVRFAATSAIGALGAAAATPNILATLRANLRGFNGSSRIYAMMAIGELGAAAATPDILATLLALLRIDDPDVQGVAADTIGDLGAAAATPDILATLLAWLRDDDWRVQSPAAYTIGMLGAAAATPDILATLLAWLRDDDWVMRYEAASAIGRLGAAAATPDILATLPALLRDTDRSVRSAAASAIRRLGAAAATPDILATLPALLRDALVRPAAASAISQFAAEGVRIFQVKRGKFKRGRFEARGVADLSQRGMEND